MNRCPLCLHDASCQEQGAPRPLHKVDCPTCGALVLTPGAVSFLNELPADDPRRIDYAKVLGMVKQRHRPIDSTTLKMWRDWLRVAGSGRGAAVEGSAAV